MNLRQIEAFRLVMLRGSMTAAAEELGTSQPSISRLIGELEASTGLTLFVRNGGRIRATDAGSAFYREVDRSFVGLENSGIRLVRSVSSAAGAYVSSRRPCWRCRSCRR